MKFNRQVSLSVLAAAVAFPTVGSAALDEIIVTAQKREETLLNVPVAVTAVRAESLEASQIRQIRDLPLLAPSLSVAQAASSAQTVFSIRGLGTSGFNGGLEPSVGVFVDGVYRSRQSSSIGDFLAVDRIEILRGPQSTLFGKNTPAGVISVITKKPQYEFGYEGEATIANYESRILRGTVTGPIVEDKVAFRLSGNYNMRDGFIDNLFDGSDVNNRDRYSLRGQLQLDPSDNLSIRIIADYESIEENCCAAPFFFNFPANVAALTPLGANLLPAMPFARQVNFDGRLFTDQTSGGGSAEITWDQDWGRVTSITAYRTFDNSNDIDADFIDLDLSGRNFNSGEYDTFTQEIRLESVSDSMVDWMVGAYYYNMDLETHFNSPYGADLRPFADLVTGGAVGLLEFLTGNAPGTFLAAGQGTIDEVFNQKTESYSIFGQVDVHLTEQLTVTGGLRWTNEEKEVDAVFNINDPFSALDLNTLFGGAFGGLSVLQFFPPAAPFSRTRDEDNFSGNAIISYQLTPSVNTYASYSRGYKSGGFNLSSSAAASGFSFEPEIADAYEIGVKARLFDDQVQLNLALFDQTLEDFQANVFNGTSFLLNNAGELNIQGVELESMAQPTENLLLTLGVTYLDAEISSFVGGPCPVFTPAATCDLSGADLPGAPDWTVSSTATYTVPLGAGKDGFIRGEVYYRGERFLGGDLDPNTLQTASTLVNASMGVVESESGRWEITVWGKNLTEEEFAQGIFDSVAQAGSFSGYPNDPLTFGITVRLRR